MQQEHVETSRVSATIPTNHLFPPQPLQTWGLDPLFASYHKMFVVLIRNYIEVQENNAFGIFEYRYFSRGIMKVEVVGIVTSISRKSKKLIISIDDGTGSIKCIKFLDDIQESAYPALKLGDLAIVKGVLSQSEVGLSDDYGFVIHIRCLDVTNDPNMELFHWTNTIVLHRDEYMQQFIPSTMYKQNATTITGGTGAVHCVCAPNRDNDITSSSCTDIDRQIYLVKMELMYCPCIAESCEQDQDSLLRIKLLHYLLLQEKNNSTNAPFIISSKALEDDPMILKIIANHQQQQYVYLCNFSQGIFNDVNEYQWDDSIDISTNRDIYVALLRLLIKLLINEQIIYEISTINACISYRMNSRHTIIPILRDTTQQHVASSPEAQQYLDVFDYLLNIKTKDKILTKILQTKENKGIPRIKLEKMYDEMMTTL